MGLGVASSPRSLDWSPWFLCISPFLFLLTQASFGELGFMYHVCRLAESYCRERLRARDIGYRILQNSN